MEPVQQPNTWSTQDRCLVTLRLPLVGSRWIVAVDRATLVCRSSGHTVVDQTHPEGRGLVNDSIGLYVTVVLLGTMLTVLVGMLLYRNGEPFLTEVLGDRERATGINRLLLVLFLLVVLGVLALISVVDVPWVDDAPQLVLTKLGVVLLVLGAAHGTTMGGLLRMRIRRRLPKLRPDAAVPPAGRAHPYDAAPGR